MLDLNLSFVHQNMITDFRDESGSSSSSVLNTEHCNSNNAGNGEGDGDGDGDGDSFHCFNFDILNVGDTGVSDDRVSQTQTEFMTRSLFPMSQVNSSLLLFPDNSSKFKDMGLGKVQQQKPIVQPQNQVIVKKSRRGPRSRSSQYRGVTFYRRTGRWESHIWDCGKQVYLGGFDTAHAAARAYDRAAIKFRGVDADINFCIADYEEDMNQQIKNLSKEDFVHLLRRHSNGFSRGKSKYGGVVIDKSGRWDAQMRHQFFGKKSYGDTNNIKSIFGASTYERETFASQNGNGPNLDLNLGISSPSCLGKGLNRNPNSGHMQLNHGSHDIRRLQMENPAGMALNGRPIISEHGQPWTGMYPTFFPSYEIGATNTRIIGGSSSGGAIAWSESHPKLTTLFKAASSGFPTPAIPTTTTATNSPAYHYPMRPPPSPPPTP